MSLDNLWQEIVNDERQPYPTFESGEMTFISYAHLEGEVESQVRKARIMCEGEALEVALADIQSTFAHYYNKLVETIES